MKIILRHYLLIYLLFIAWIGAEQTREMNFNLVTGTNETTASLKKYSIKYFNPSLSQNLQDKEQVWDYH